MSKIKVFLLSAAFLAILIAPSFVSAATAEELQAQINALLAQIKQLQVQLAQVQGTTPQQWCHDFNMNLKIGDRGSEVEALYKALEKEGFDTTGSDADSQKEKVIGYFGENAASIISGFQQKYKDEILTPLNLQYGTGFVGRATRAKLNKLYGCGGITPSPVCAQLACPIGQVANKTGEVDSNGCPIMQCAHSISACPIFTGCASGYPYDIGIKDSNGCPVMKCTTAPIETCSAPVCGTGYTSYSAGRDSNGCEILKCIPITGNQPPVINGVKGPTTLQVNETGTWTVSASDPENGTLSYYVFWGDEAVRGLSASASTYGGTGYGQSVTFTHSYASAGIYYPSFSVTDNQGLAAKTSISVNVGEMVTPPPIPTTVSEQVKCVFKGATTDQKCYTAVDSSSSLYYGKGCGGTGACVVDLKGFQGDKITWKSTCGGYAYTTMDGNSEYAEFNCLPVPIATACPLPVCASEYTSYDTGQKDNNGCPIIKCTSSSYFITVLSPNGGEQWPKGTTQILQWKSSPDITSVYMKLRKGSDTYSGFEGVVSPGVSNAGTDPGRHQWTIPTTLPDGNDYAIRIVDSRGTVLDDSDAPFSIVTTIPQNHSPKITGGSTLPPSIQAGQNVNFSWNAQDEDKDNLVWEVDWGDGERMWTACSASNLSNGQGWNLITYHTWAQVGTYTVKVTVSDCKGGTDSQTLAVNVGVGSTAVTPSITVLYPNGGEKLEKTSSRDTYTVTWQVSGSFTQGSKQVILEKSGAQIVKYSGNAENANSFNLTLSSSPNIVSGSDYKIKVELVDTNGKVIASDTSDDYFTIVMPEVSQSTSFDQMAGILNSAQETLNKIQEALKNL